MLEHQKSFLGRVNLKTYGFTNKKHPENKYVPGVSIKGIKQLKTSVKSDDIIKGYKINNLQELHPIFFK